MKKKLLATLLCAAMTMSLLAGCGGAEETAEPAAESAPAQETKEEAEEPAASSGEVVTVGLHIPALATFQEDAVVEVEAALNEILEPKYGINVDLTFIEMGNFADAVNLAMTTDEVDVTCYFPGGGTLDNYVRNGQLLDITDYFNASSAEFQGLFNEAEIASATRDGRMYGAPRKYQYGGHETIVMNKEIVDALGIDAKSIDSMDKLDELLYQVHEAYPDIYAMVPQSGAEMTWLRPFNRVGTTNFLCVDVDPKATELKSLFETDSYKEFCSYTRQWYQDGLIMQDAISNTIEGSTMVSSGAAFCTLHNGDLDDLATVYPNTVQGGIFVAPQASSDGVGNLAFGISANSAYPDESFKLLEAIFVDKEVATTLIYGVEGKHHVINENGRVAYPEGLGADNNPYGGFASSPTFPNYLAAPAKDTMPADDMAALVNDWNNSVEILATSGFVVDTAKYTDFTTAYTNIEDKYYQPTMTGTISLEETLPAIIEELEGIGFYDVLAECQAELDAYLAQ